jgi:hypothetical protein
MFLEASVNLVIHWPPQAARPCSMIELFRFALAVLASPFKSKLRLEAENAVLETLRSLLE